MILSVGAIFLSNPESADYSYGKYSFKSESGYWTSKLAGKTISFYQLPEQVLNHGYSSEVTKLIKNSQGFIVSFDQNQNSTSKLQVIDLMRLELMQALLNTKSTKYLGYGVTQPGINYNLSVFDCKNSSWAYPVIVVTYGNTTNLSTENSCIKATAADEYGMLTINDYLKYGLYGVINEK